MDIAEIRKKAKGGGAGGGKASKEAAPSPAQTSTPVQTTASPPVDTGAPPAPAPLAVSATVVVPPSSEAAAIGMDKGQSALDRLFASNDGVQFASEEVYQTALAAQGIQDESELSQFLAFQIGTEEYALDIGQISEIIKPRDYTDIPRVPDFILGLISLRGGVVPILDLRQRFRMGSVEVSSAARIIVCREGGVTAGLLVDKINQVVKIAADRIEPPPAVIAGIDRSLIAGVGRYQGRMIILLNLVSVLEIASV